MDRETEPYIEWLSSQIKNIAAVVKCREYFGIRVGRGRGRHSAVLDNVKNLRHFTAAFKRKMRGRDKGDGDGRRTAAMEKFTIFICFVRKNWSRGSFTYVGYSRVSIYLCSIYYYEYNRNITYLAGILCTRCDVRWLISCRNVSSRRLRFPTITSLFFFFSAWHRDLLHENYESWRLRVKGKGP